MHRVLMVTYYFPPLGGIASLRALGFAEHLPSFGWEPVVLAPGNGAYFRDPSLAFPGGRTVRTWSLELSRLGKRGLGTGGDDVQPANVEGLRGALRELARQRLYFPDAQIGWYPSAAVAGRRLVRDHGFDAVFSSSFPITAHLIARAIHRRSGIPWIAEFRDPWSSRMPDGGDRRFRRALRLERSIASEASAVVMTSPSWAAEHSRLWGRSVSTIPNGCGRVPPSSSPGEELVVCFLGSYYPGRQDLSAVWKAVALINADPSSPKVRVRIVGEASPAIRAELRAAGVEGSLEVTGFLAHEEALRRVASASLLVAAGPAHVDAAEEGWVPAKLFEYLATGLPIVWVGINPNDGASLLAGHPGCRILEPDQVDGIVTAIREQAGQRYRRELQGLDRRHRASSLAQLLDSHSRSGQWTVPGVAAAIEVP